MNDEIVLSGGTLNRVVKVGETVRRPAAAWTSAVQALLAHLHDSGFLLAPQPLGTDEQGREILSWIEGETVGWALPWPEPIRSDVLLQAVGRAVAALHRATVGFEAGPGAGWQDGPPPTPARSGHVICHNDLAPYNVVLRDGELAGIIDWDQAGPGDPLSDLAFVAWQWVPLHGPMVSTLMGWVEPPDRARRCRLLLDAYGLDDRSGFIDAVEQRILYNRTVMTDRAAAGDAAYQALVDGGHLIGMDEALAALESDRDELQRSL